MHDNGNGQFELFDDTPSPRKLARTHDPATSKLAAYQVHVFSGKHHRRIYDALCRIESGTFYEIADEADMEPACVWRRLNEMERKGHIFLTGKERLGPTGRLCRIWTITTK